MKKIKEAIFIIKDMLSGNETGEEDLEVSKPLTSQELENQIFGHYKMRFDEETTFNEETKTGSMAFPVSFCIYLHPIDYKKLAQRFRFTVKNVINAFCAYNRKRIVLYPGHIPHSPYWTIQFVPFSENSFVEKAGEKYETVEIGFPIIFSDLFSRKFTKDNIVEGNSVQATKKHRNLFSLHKVNLAINENAFRNIRNDIKDEDTFIIKINEGYNELTTIPKNESETKIFEEDAMAELVCDREFIGQSKEKYLITTNYIFISGKNDTRPGAQYVKINYPLPDSIVQIKHENKKFWLAAFGKVRLNQMLVPESDGAPDWVELSDKSKMLINDEVSIEFKRIKR